MKDSLREEFNEFANPTREGYEQPEDLHLFYPRKYNKEIADWWLEKFSSHSTELVSKGREEMAKEVIAFIDSGHREPTADTGWSIDIDDVRTFINQEK